MTMAVTPDDKPVEEWESLDRGELGLSWKAQTFKKRDYFSKGWEEHVDGNN